MWTSEGKSSHVAYLSFFAAADAHFPVHPLSAGELAVEAETAPGGGNDYSIRECVITFSLSCMLSQPVECHTFAVLICKLRKKRVSQLWTKNDMCPLHFLDLNASVCHVKTINPDWTCAVKYQMSCSLGYCVAAQGKSLYCIVFPIHQTLLSGGSRSSCC